VRDPGTAVGVVVALALGGCVIGENPYWDPHSTASSSGTSTGPGPDPGTTRGTTASEGSSPLTSTAGSSTGIDATTGPQGSMGQPCTSDDSCDEGQSCCESVQCLDTCTIFCALDRGICPAGMLCAHGYCLLQCNDDDEDCASWPGFTCEHEGTACENYEPVESTGTGATGSTTGG